MIDLVFAAGVSLSLAPDAGPDAAITALIAEARSFAAEQGDTIWPGFANAPDTVILVDGEVEYLLCHERPAEAFQPLADDPVTGCSLAVRDRTFPPNFLASFPAVDGTPSTIVGTPEATGRSPDDWMITLLHEHLHQMQDATPGSYQAAMALDIHGGDQTGMWQLNYDFPYQDEATASAALALAQAARAALAQRGEDGFVAAAEAFIAERETFLATVSLSDRRYYELQSWKEGVARWTELAITRAGADTDDRLAAMAAEQENRLIASLERVDLSAQGRVAFYALGAAEAEILEHLSPAWREHYFTHMYDMAGIFAAVREP